jgi:DNA-directed RNA polymerase subunit RPC12/RpoP
MADEIDYELTDEIVCPYCGHEHGDSHEYFERQLFADVECAECGKEFECSQDVSVTYTSSKKEKPDAT